MKTRLFRSLAAAMVFLAAPAALAQITVGNVRVAQRAGTKLVDIDYNLTGLAKPCKVWLEISADGGTTWTVPATSVSGAVGNSVTPGENLRSPWDAGADWNRQFSNRMRFRIRADDQVTEPLSEPSGFAPGADGPLQMNDARYGMTDGPVQIVSPAYRRTNPSTHPLST